MRALLLSGGVDSSAIAYWLRPELCLTIDYGQRPAAGEIAAARALCTMIGLAHETLVVDMKALGSGSLSGGPPSALAKAEEWWPFRNQMLITIAGMHLLSAGVRQIMLGAVRTDIHADGRPPFLKAIDRVMNVQEGGVRVTAPASKLDSVELLSTSRFPKDLFGLTFSCHVLETPCGRCRGCEKQADVLKRARFPTAQTLSNIEAR